MEDIGATPQEWRLNPDRDLVLSDVHLGVGRSETIEVQTSVLQFSWRPAVHVGTQLQPHAVVPAGSGGKQYCEADRPLGPAFRASQSGHDVRMGSVPTDEDKMLHAPSVITAACDADGDLLLERRHPLGAPKEATLSLQISHRMATPLRDVGMQVGASDVHRSAATRSVHAVPIVVCSPYSQASPHWQWLRPAACCLLALSSIGRPCLRLQVWRGSLLLAEYLLSRASDFENTAGCELGAGTGVAGIALACAGARRVFVTDIGSSVLDLCQVSISANCSATGHRAFTRAVCAGWLVITQPLSNEVSFASGYSPGLTPASMANALAAT